MLLRGYEIVIGIETHVQLLTATKMFCRCSTRFGVAPNTHVCPTCLGLPGALPVPNRHAIDLALKLLLAVGAEIHEESVWSRKNYFYPDLPKGYQISQYDKPIATGGRIVSRLRGERRDVPLVRVHLEEDAGKSLHPEHDHHEQVTGIDLNRAGTPLCEIVTEPVMRSPEEAGAYLTALRQLVQYLGISDGNMEEGSLRADANVSVHLPGTPFGTRTEIKNLNSFRHVERALAFEAERQVGVLEAGGTVQQATLLYDPATDRCEVMRTKEDAHDYRYFPEPDLPPLRVSRAWIDAVRAEMPELPWAREERFETAYGLPAYDAAILADTRTLADYFETVVAGGVPPKQASNWIMTELRRVITGRGVKASDIPVSAAALTELLLLLEDGTVNGKVAKEVFEEMVAGGGSPRAIVAAKGLTQIADPEALRAAVREVLASSPSQLAQYRSGQDKVFQFFIGQTMKATRGRAHPDVLQRVLKEELAG